jgi:hypothetical protein
MKKILLGLILLVAAFMGLRYYLIVKPVDYPVNRDPGWNHGDVFHILPTVNHERFLIKTSFTRRLADAPVLKVGQAAVVKGVKTDTEGRFWTFDAGGLAPDTEYELSLSDAGGKKLCDPWPLKTFPHPNSKPKRLRLLVYT